MKWAGMFLVGAITMGSLFSPSTVTAHPFTVDQSNVSSVPSGRFSIPVSGPIDQEFRPTLHSLDVVELFTSTPAPIPGGASLFVDIRQGSIGGLILGTSWTVLLPDFFQRVAHFDREPREIATLWSSHLAEPLAVRALEPVQRLTSPSPRAGPRCQGGVQIKLACVGTSCLVAAKASNR